MNVLLNPVNFVLFVVMLGILVFVHEFGHFGVAKRLGIPVLEFGFGFPPRLFRFWKGGGWIEVQGRRIAIPRNFPLPQNLNVDSYVTYKTKHENGREILTAIDVIDAKAQSIAFASQVQKLDRGTEYTMNAIPLGGFVRLVGEEDPNVPGGFASAKPLVRAPILLAGVTMNFLLAFLTFIVAAYSSPPYAPVQTTRITDIAPGSPAAMVGLRQFDTIVAVNGQNVKNDVNALTSLLRSNAGQTVTLSVVRNGITLEPIRVVPRQNPPQGEGPLGIRLDGSVGLRVMGVEAGSVADRAGVRVGDVLVFIVDPRKGRPLQDQNELADFVKTHPNWKVEWRIQRNGQLLENPLVVQIPESVTATNATLGLSFQPGLLDAPRLAAQEMQTILGAIPTMFAQMVSGSAPAVGFLGIYQATGEVAQRGGPIALIQFLGLLSLNLAIVNLLPFPALDGGRLVFVIIEWLRGGKKVDPQKEGLVHLVGIMVLISLMLVITFFDAQRLLSGRTIFPSP